MGVSGSGKTTIGLELSNVLEIPFYDADDYHNEHNIRKMKKGNALNDTDRESWLNLLSLKIKKWNLYGDAILACSALKESYRHKLSNDNQTLFIFLNGDYDLIYQRLFERKGHFFLESMLKGQFSELEKPVDCISISIDQPISDICLLIVGHLKRLKKCRIRKR